MDFSDHLIGACDIYVDDEFIERCRCWLDWSAEKFVVETSVTQRATSEPQLDADGLAFRNLVFLSQTGELTADELLVSFASYVPSWGGARADDCVIGRHLDAVRLLPRWHFVCNEPITLKSREAAQEILFRPGGKGSLRWTGLECGASVLSTPFGICVAGHEVFEDAHIQALSLAVGCPLSEFVRHEGNAVRICLNHANRPGEARPLFDPAENGFAKLEKWWEGVAEVYRAALCFQQAQADGGKQFRYAVQAFLEARSYPAGFALKILAAMQFLEWLDDRGTIEFGQLAKRLGIPREVARAVKDLRDAFSHNHTRISLIEAADDVCAELVKAGVFSEHQSPDERRQNLLNFVLSLVGKLLLERIGAKVEPVNYLPGFGNFSVEG